MAESDLNEVQARQEAEFHKNREGQPSEGAAVRDTQAAQDEQNKRNEAAELAANAAPRETPAEEEADLDLGLDDLSGASGDKEEEKENGQP